MATIIKYALNFIACILLLTIAACGSSDSFRINGEIEGLGTRNLRFYYYDGRAMQVGIASAIDSKFSFEGRSKNPALLTITTGQRNVLGRLVVENGDAIELKLKSDNPYSMKVSGNKVAEDYARFINENTEILNSGDSEKINKAVVRYVTANPSKMAAAVVLVAHYNTSVSDKAPAEADSLLSTINQKARPAQIVTGYRSLYERYAAESQNEPVVTISGFSEADSLFTRNIADAKRTLLIFANGPAIYIDSLNSRLDTIIPKTNNSLKAVINLGLEPDTIMWHQTLCEAKPKGLNLWIPGSVSSPRLKEFSLKRLPAYVVLDSLGKRLYSGESAAEAVEIFRRE